jgi:hypothetical protein
MCLEDERATGRWSVVRDVLLRELSISNVILIDYFLSELNVNDHKGIA